MAVLADQPADHPALRDQAAVLARPMTPERRMADAARALVIDAVAAAARGEAGGIDLGAMGLGMGMADAATALWGRVLKFDAADPHWPDRDRFVMSAADGAALLHALLHLTGHDHAAPDLVHGFPGRDAGLHPAVEVTSGAPGEGLGAAIGLALGERLLAARFGKSLVDHRTWVLACEADLMAGVSHEAASLAGHLRLEKLTVLYEDCGVPSPATSDDVARRFVACGWAVQRVDGHDAGELASALSFAVRAKKPTLLAVRTVIGVGAPGPRPAAEARRALDWHEHAFETPAEIAAQWGHAGVRGAAARRAWLKRLARHPQRGEFERVIAGRLPESWHEAMATVKAALAQGPAMATDAASQLVLAALVPAIPELIGGLAGAGNGGHDHGWRDPQSSFRSSGTVSPGAYGGRSVLYGHRAHGMAAAGNGLALHGGLVPVAASAIDASEAMRPAWRLAGTMRQRVIHVATEGDAGPADQLAGLRAMPNLFLFRPADALETAECWELALRRADGPSLLVLGRQPNACLRSEASENRCARGGYVLAAAAGDRQATLIASGAEVALAMAARIALASEGISVAVVSLPCWELFAQQDGAYRAEVLGSAPRLGVEATGGFGWDRWLGADGHFIGLSGTDGPTQDAIVASVTRRVG